VKTIFLILAGLSLAGVFAGFGYALIPTWYGALIGWLGPTFLFVWLWGKARDRSET